METQLRLLQDALRAGAETQIRLTSELEHVRSQLTELRSQQGSLVAEHNVQICNLQEQLREASAGRLQAEKSVDMMVSARQRDISRAKMAGADAYKGWLVDRFGMAKSYYLKTALPLSDGQYTTLRKVLCMDFVDSRWKQARVNLDGIGTLTMPILWDVNKIRGLRYRLYDTFNPRQMGKVTLLNTERVFSRELANRGNYVCDGDGRTKFTFFVDAVRTRSGTEMTPFCGRAFAKQGTRVVLSDADQVKTLGVRMR